MSRIPNCRVDENYNQKYLNEQDKEFVAGYDWAVQEILNLFCGNIDVYPDLELLLDDKKAIIQDDKEAIVRDSIEHWTEMHRDELITSMIDNMDEDEYAKIKEAVDNGIGVNESDT